MNKIIDDEIDSPEPQVCKLVATEEITDQPFRQDLVKDWVRDVMQPVHVSYLINELSYDSQLREDISAAKAEFYLHKHTEWVSCKRLVEDLRAGDLSHLHLVVNLALDGTAVTEEEADYDDLLFFWVHTCVKTEVDCILPWRHLSEISMDRRDSLCLYAVYRDNSSTYQNGIASLVGAATFEELESQSDLFCRASDCFLHCKAQLISWVAETLLECNGFVDTGTGELFTPSSPVDLCEAYGLDYKEGSGMDTMTWFLVTDSAGRAIQRAGGIVLELDSSDRRLWGRTTFGQEICMDGVIERAERLYSEIYHQK